MLECRVMPKYGPDIEDCGPQRYYCAAYPCPNLTTLFYRPWNSMLCEDCIKRKQADAAIARAQPVEETDGR